MAVCPWVNSSYIHPLLSSSSIPPHLLKLLGTGTNRLQHINIPPGVWVGQALTGAWLSVSESWLHVLILTVFVMLRKGHDQQLASGKGKVISLLENFSSGCQEFSAWGGLLMSIMWKSVYRKSENADPGWGKCLLCVVSQLNNSLIFHWKDL